MKVPHLGRVARRLVGRFSSQEDVERDDLFLPHLMGAFARAADIMAKENHHLQENDIAGAAALLPEKTATIEELTALAGQARRKGVHAENLPASFQQVQRRFSEVAAQNAELLQAALVTQEAVMKLLIESAVEANRHGYGWTGEAGSDTSRGSLSLNDQA
ncbi:hypothetical protein [Bombella mellum]|uniref:Flagellar protein FlgN n=1 Tax=Bombella mellum TaxID=2039288 RepID=A0ABR5ZSZ9_9PROT|nr:hypothetical protein [Bombella mellum]MBA5727453.1 hypothetical protein [Bombella mellum]